MTTLPLDVDDVEKHLDPSCVLRQPGEVTEDFGMFSRASLERILKTSFGVPRLGSFSSTGASGALERMAVRYQGGFQKTPLAAGSIMIENIRLRMFQTCSQHNLQSVVPDLKKHHLLCFIMLRI